MLYKKGNIKPNFIANLKKYIHTYVVKQAFLLFSLQYNFVFGFSTHLKHLKLVSQFS